RELTSTFDDEVIHGLVTTTLMGHLMVSRCALYRTANGALALAHARGVRGEEAGRAFTEAEAQPVLDALRTPLAVADLPPGPVRERLADSRMALVVPLSAIPARRWAGTTTISSPSRAAGWPSRWPTCRARAPRPASSWLRSTPRCGPWQDRARPRRSWGGSTASCSRARRRTST